MHITIVITSYKLQKYDIFAQTQFGGNSSFQTTQDKLSLGALYDLNIIIMKKNCKQRNFDTIPGYLIFHV